MDENKRRSPRIPLDVRVNPIESIGKVMWCKKAIEYLFENGISFWDIKDKEQLEIKKYLEGKMNE